MGKMIYSILASKTNPERLNGLLPGTKGLAGAELFVLSFDDICAIVSDKEKASLITDKSTVLEYAAVIETLFQHFTLLPMRFGSWMESGDAVIHLLEKNHRDIQQNLLQVENKHEFGLKILCNPGKFLEGLKIKSEPAFNDQRAPVREGEKSPAREWMNKKLKEHRLEESMVTFIDSVSADVAKQLDRLNAIRQIKKMVTPATILDAVFLLEKTRKPELMQVAGNLQEKYPTLNFIMTGPWPPYNFVNFTVK